MFFHCIGCHQPFKTIYRCVHCPISSQTFATLSDHHHQQQQALLGEKQGQSNYTYLCTNCERKSFFYHFWDHSFVRVWNWSSSEEELTKLIESKKLSRTFNSFLFFISFHFISILDFCLIMKRLELLCRISHNNY